ncbi:insulinase family protein, partial [Psychrosphaera sp.]|nr:insulinase family protein [Psychrosphaera sp.]
ENVLARLQEFTWATGTQVSIYPKKLRAGEVNMAMTFPVGSAKSLKGYEADFKMLGGLLMSGTEKYSKEQIASKMDELKASINISTRTLGEINVSVKAVKENLDATLDFIQELLANPTFKASEVEIDRKAMITGLEMNRSEPSSVAVSILSKTFNGHEAGHPSAFKTIDEQIEGLKKVTSKRLKKLHSSHFNVSNGFVAIVGDVEPKIISTQLEMRLSELNGTATYAKLEDETNDVTGQENWIETPDKANAQLYIAHVVDLNPQEDDYYAAYIANQIFGGSGFASRLMQRIRVKEGYSYGTGSWLQMEFDEEKGMYIMSAIAAPENMKKVVEAYKVLAEGFSDKEVTDAINGALKSLRVTWSSEAYIARMLNGNKQMGRDMKWFSDYQETLPTVTVEQVNAAFAKYIAQQELNIFAAGDWAKLEK